MKSYTILPVIFLVLLTSCATSGISTEIEKERIPSGAKVYVMQALDGLYGPSEYKGSGILVSKKVLEAARTIQPTTQLIEETNKSKAIKSAQANGVHYIIEPVLEHWEDRVNLWSGLPDKIIVVLNVIKVNDSNVVLSKSFHASSSPIPLENTKIDTLLDIQFDYLVMSLFEQ